MTIRKIKWLNIVPENSVPSQMKPLLSVFPFISICLSNGLNTIIDVGAGRMRNVPVLCCHFKKVWAVDTELQFSRIGNILEGVQRKCPTFKTYLVDTKFQQSNLKACAAICICVVHIIPEKSIRYRLLNSVAKNLRHQGLLLIDVPFGVPYYESKLSRGNLYKDGFLLGSGRIRTFYKEYSSDELQHLAEGVGFEYLVDLNITRHHAFVFRRK